MCTWNTLLAGDEQWRSRSTCHIKDQCLTSSTCWKKDHQPVTRLLSPRYPAIMISAFTAINSPPQWTMSSPPQCAINSPPQGAVNSPSHHTVNSPSRHTVNSPPHHTGNSLPQHTVNSGGHVEGTWSAGELATSLSISQVMAWTKTVGKEYGFLALVLSVWGIDAG